LFFKQFQNYQKTTQLSMKKVLNKRNDALYFMNFTPCGLCSSSKFLSFRLVRSPQATRRGENLSGRIPDLPKAFGIAGMTPGNEYSNNDTPCGQYHRVLHGRIVLI